MENRHEWLHQQAQVLLDRLERLSVDSVWAHKASGLRGSLIRSLSELDEGKIDKYQLIDLMEEGFQILHKAAREIPEDQ